MSDFAIMLLVYFKRNWVPWKFQPMATARVGALPLHAASELVIYVEIAQTFDQSQKAEFVGLSNAENLLHNIMYGVVCEPMNQNLNKWFERIEVTPRIKRKECAAKFLKELGKALKPRGNCTHFTLEEILRMDPLDLYDKLELGFNASCQATRIRISEDKPPLDPAFSTVCEAREEIIKVCGWANLLSNQSVESVLAKLSNSHLDPMIALEVSKTILVKRNNVHSASFSRVKEMDGILYHFTVSDELEVTELMDQCQTFLFWVRMREDVSGKPKKLYPAFREFLAA